jgi:hypothetical protein
MRTTASDIQPKPVGASHAQDPCDLVSSGLQKFAGANRANLVESIILLGVWFAKFTQPVRTVNQCKPSTCAGKQRTSLWFAGLRTSKIPGDQKISECRRTAMP